MGEAKRRKAILAIAAVAKCSPPPVVICSNLLKASSPPCRETPERGQVVLLEPPRPKEEPLVLDIREESVNYAEVIPASEIKPVPRRRPTPAFSLMAWVMALAVPMGGATMDEEDLESRRRRR